MFDHIYANYFSYSLPYWISPIICTCAYFPPFILTFLNFCIPSTFRACIPFPSMLACLYFCHFAILNSANPASLHPGILEFLQHCYCFSILAFLHACMLAFLYSCIFYLSCISVSWHHYLHSCILKLLYSCNLTFLFLHILIIACWNSCILEFLHHCIL